MAEQFVNDPIPTEHLPHLADEAFVAVDGRYLQVSLIGMAISSVLVIAGGVLGAILVEPLMPLLVAGVMVALLGGAALFRMAEVRRLAYQAREHDLSVRSGVLTHRVQTLPFTRVQHVNVQRGPIERWLGLATLMVSSAGPDLVLPGLAVETADRIKALVSERVGVDLSDTPTAIAPTQPGP